MQFGSIWEAEFEIHLQRGFQNIDCFEFRGGEFLL